MTVLLEPLRGRINDVDSHEMVPVPLYEENFGEAGARLAQVWGTQAKEASSKSANSLVVDVAADTLVIDEPSVWERCGWVTGSSAPGAIDMTRRLDVLDLMGVRCQNIFPTGAVAGIMLQTASPEFIATVFGREVDTTAPEWAAMQSLARDVLSAWNRWAARHAADSPRLRPVAVLMKPTVAELTAEAKRLVSEGVRGFMLPASVPPGGASPAHDSLDPFWSLCEEFEVGVYIHIAAENFMKTMEWRQIPLFMDMPADVEFLLDPYSLATVHFPAANYLTAAILGGVFERHPRLNVGVFECGAHWVGPLAENLDMWADYFAKRMKGTLSISPSAYLRRNIRVSPFYFEPVDQYIERYDMPEVFCFASDYPHIEGGKRPMDIFAERLAPLGGDVLEKFFVTNGARFFPDLGSAGT